MVLISYLGTSTIGVSPKKVVICFCINVAVQTLNGNRLYK